MTEVIITTLMIFHILDMFCSANARIYSIT